MKSWNRKLNVSDAPLELMSEAGRMKDIVGLLVLVVPNSSQVSVIVTEVPASAVPSSAGAVLLVTGMLPSPVTPMETYGGVVGVSSRLGAGGAEVGAGCERSLALSMNVNVTGVLRDPASSVA